MRFIVVGPVPPPIGGVSVFVHRFARHLASQGHAVETIDFDRLSFVGKLFFLVRAVLAPGHCAFYLNGVSTSLMLALILRPFPKQLTYHDHSGRGLLALSKLQITIFRLFVSRVTELLIVKDHLKRYYSDLDIPLPASTKVQNAFLPPPAEDEARIIDSYPDDLKRFLRAHSPLILANAYRLVFHAGEDLYGLDLSVDLMAKIAQTHPRAGLVFALAEVDDRAYFDAILKRLASQGIQDRVFFLSGQRELWPLFKEAQLLIRPTNTDGDAISIREALYFGCRVIASDVCERPEGVVVFRSRDVEDLVVKVNSVLAEGIV